MQSPSTQGAHDDMLARFDSIAADRKPVVALDLDDVLSATNVAVAQCTLHHPGDVWAGGEETTTGHNETYGTSLSLADFYYYHWWKNPGWGTPAQTFAKVNQLYATGRPYNAPVVPGAQQGVRQLHNMGCRLVVVTAREKHEMEESRRWLQEHFAGLIDEVISAGMPSDNAEDSGSELYTSLSKAQVCQKLHAHALVDDSRENALACATAVPSVRVLVFGDTAWGQRRSVVRGPKRPEDFDGTRIAPGDAAGIDITQMGFDERLRYEDGGAFWEEDARSEESRIPENAPVTFTRDWPAVVAWVKEHVPGLSQGTVD